MAEDDLKQRDLSHLGIQQMSAVERAEMRRRYEAFLRAIRPSGPAPSEAGRSAPPRPWVPGTTR